MENYKEFCQNDTTLRNYQQQAKEKIFSQWNVVDNVMYQMPTGTGKTRLFTSIIRDICLYGLKHNNKFRILIIAHRKELIDQCSSSLDKYRIDHGVLSGTLKERYDLKKMIQVASIQTITHQSNIYLLNDLKFDFIIIDEAHHSTANSYHKLWEYCPNSKKLGVTASPWRMNGNGFTNLFESFIPSMQIKEFIRLGWLASYQYYSIPTNSQLKNDIDSINEFDIEGDYRQSALEKVVDTSHIRAQLYESYKNLAYGKKGIIYSISRTHSENICAQFDSFGIRIKNIDSKTPTRERENIINEFKQGHIDIIVNVDIFSEGFDCPDIEFIQLARPTRSLVKYIQQVGRGIRKNGEKRCIILDNVGMYSRFGLPDQDRDWQTFYEGKEVNAPLKKSDKSIDTLLGKDYSTLNITEGNEQMVLIQDVQSPSKEIIETINKDEETKGNNNEPLEVEANISNIKSNTFSIRSKVFFNGKYQIEETENGFFLYNVKKLTKCFLMKTYTFPGGFIEIQKETAKNEYTIIKTTNIKSAFSINFKIIGYIKKDGLITRFTSFDNSIVNLNVGI